MRTKQTKKNIGTEERKDHILERIMNLNTNEEKKVRYKILILTNSFGSSEFGENCFLIWSL